MLHSDNVSQVSVTAIRSTDLSTTNSLIFNVLFRTDLALSSENFTHCEMKLAVSALLDEVECNEGSHGQPGQVIWLLIVARAL